MTNLDAARFQMAYSLGFHMIFAALGVGMPMLMIMAEALWLRTGKQHYLNLARTWAKATGVLFAIGAVSGTGLSFEMGLLWPEFMRFAGSTIGPAFTLEGYAFFTEAIFLGLYLYGWERLSAVGHWLCGLVVAVSGAASSVLVVATNAWMQNPLGVDVLVANPEALDAVGVLFRNRAWAVMALHSTLACYAATAFAVAGIYAWGLLKGRTTDLHRSALSIVLVIGSISAVAMFVTGHTSAVDVATRQPAKLAAMESQFRTEAGAPLRIGGIPYPESGEVRYSLEIPRLLSILAYNDPNAVVAGLDQFPREEWPNVRVTHIAFQLMVASGTAMLLVCPWYWWKVLRRRVVQSRALLWALVAVSPLGFVALEAGWVVTEVGRQPWIIYGVMRTSEAVTPAPGLLQTMIGFVALYTMLAVVLVVMLRRLKHMEWKESE